MRYIVLLSLLSLFYSVHGRNGGKAATETGNGVIEITDQLKELPPGLEEEPSGEQTDDEKFGNTIPPATKETRKTTTVETRRRNNEKMIEDEETKIEKQLAELYRDAPDYKADSSEKEGPESTRQNNTAEPLEMTETEDLDDKPVGRQGSKSEFKFQPDVTNKAAIEKFRTSIDVISCDKRVTQKYSDSKKPADSNFAVKPAIWVIHVLMSILTIFYC